MNYITGTLIVLLGCIICQIGNSQKPVILQGIVSDRETGEPINGAYVISDQKSIGVLTDDQGYFSLYLPAKNERDSILIRHLGYESTHLSLAEVVSKRRFELSPKPYELPGLTVREVREKIRAKEIFKRAILDYRTNKRNGDHIARAIYSEKAQYNGEWIMYMESLGYAIHSELREEAAPLSNYNFYCEQTRSHVMHPDWKAFRSNLPEVDPTETVLPAAGTSLIFLRHLEASGVLSAKKLLWYHCSLDTVYWEQGMPVYSIRFSKKSAEGNMEILKKGDRYHVRKINMTSNSYWSTAYCKRVKADVVIEFDYLDNIPYLSSVESHYHKYGLDHYNSLQVLVHKMVPFSLDRDEYWALNSMNLDPYISYDHEEASKYGMEHRPEFVRMTGAFSDQGDDLFQEFSRFTDRWFVKDLRGDRKEVRHNGREIMGQLKALFE